MSTVPDDSDITNKKSKGDPKSVGSRIIGFITQSITYFILLSIYFIPGSNILYLTKPGGEYTDGKDGKKNMFNAYQLDLALPDDITKPPYSQPMSKGTNTNIEGWDEMFKILNPSPTKGGANKRKKDITSFMDDDYYNPSNLLVEKVLQLNVFSSPYDFFSLDSKYPFFQKVECDRCVNPNTNTASMWCDILCQFIRFFTISMATAYAYGRKLLKNILGSLQLYRASKVDSSFVTSCIFILTPMLIMSLGVPIFSISSLLTLFGEIFGSRSGPLIFLFPMLIIGGLIWAILVAISQQFYLAMFLFITPFLGKGWSYYLFQLKKHTFICSLLLWVPVIIATTNNIDPIAGAILASMFIINQIYNFVKSLKKST